MVSAAAASLSSLDMASASESVRFPVWVIEEAMPVALYTNRLYSFSNQNSSGWSERNASRMISLSSAVRKEMSHSDPISETVLYSESYAVFCWSVRLSYAEYSVSADATNSDGTKRTIASTKATTDSLNKRMGSVMVRVLIYLTRPDFHRIRS